MDYGAAWRYSPNKNSLPKKIHSAKKENAVHTNLYRHPKDIILSY